MVNLIVTGSTNPSDLNGTYIEDGVFEGETRYKHEDKDYWILKEGAP